MLTKKVVKTVQFFVLSLLMVSTWVIGVGVVEKSDSAVSLVLILSQNGHSADVDIFAGISFIWPMFLMLFYWLAGTMGKKIKFLRKKRNRNTSLVVLLAVGIAFLIALYIAISPSRNGDIVTKGLKVSPLTLIIFYLVAMVEPVLINYFDSHDIPYGTYATFDGRIAIMERRKKLEAEQALKESEKNASKSDVSE